MKHVCQWALDTATAGGASYADVRVITQRSRALSTKNGKIGNASDAESVGMNVRLVADGAWGFAASADLGRGAVEATAARTVQIAKASARVTREAVRLAPERPSVAEWSTPYRIDPFTTSVEQNIELLLKIDAELRAVAGITLAEANLNFNREEQWFASSEGADIHQTKLSSGAGYAAYSFAVNEIQKRSYPNWRMRGGLPRRLWRCIAPINVPKGHSTSFSIARSSGYRFMSQSGIRLNSIACSGWKRTSPGLLF